MLENGVYKVPKGRLATVVTYLEMTAPAALRPGTAPEGSELTARPKPQLDWYRNLFKRVGALDWLWFSRLRMSDAELSAILHDPLVEVYALDINGQSEGLLELDFRQDSACELSFFGVTSALIGTGAGRYLMNQAITRAWSKPIARFHLHTCTLDHPDALEFYTRSGFTPISQQIEIADDPRATGEFPARSGPRTPVFG